MISLLYMIVAHPNVLTSIHVDLVLLTLKSHSYDLLLSPLLLDFSTSSTNPPIISQSYLTSITTFTHNVEEKWTLDVLDYLTYWYYLGMVWCALKKWELAQEALLMVCTLMCISS